MDDKQENTIFVVINNIPKDYRSSDLRNYFSQFIESEGFECFHFKHRPEVQKQFEDDMSNDSKTSTSSEQQNSKNTLCCVVKMRPAKYTEFIHMYNKHHWLDKRGDSIPALCCISKIKVAEETANAKYMTRKEKKAFFKEKEEVTVQDLKELPELNPPLNIMPNGNVGTKTRVFLDLIAQCKLPPKVISKLGLVFPKRRSNRRYGCVHFDYRSSENPWAVKEIEYSLDTKRGSSDTGDVINGGDCENFQSKKEGFEVESASGHMIHAENEFIKHGENSVKKKKMTSTTTDKDQLKPEDDSSEEDEDRCEEWERHEALHDDPANVERNKERLFEERIELKWEKGGSGLVFYTDAQYWQQQEGDFDEQTTDDWDVDMSCYYEENGGDKDAKDSVSMRQEKRRRDGQEATDMGTAGFMRKRKKPKHSSSSDTVEEEIGQFEQYTKGVGRKVLEKQGWREGQGVGGSVKGMTSALDNDGQVPSDKRGIGYYGEKVVRFTAPKPQRQLKDFVISTVYDNPRDTDPSEPLLRRQSHLQIKHRKQSVRDTDPSEPLLRRWSHQQIKQSESDTDPIEPLLRGQSHYQIKHKKQS